MVKNTLQGQEEKAQQFGRQQKPVSHHKQSFSAKRRTARHLTLPKEDCRQRRCLRTAETQPHRCDLLSHHSQSRRQHHILAALHSGNPGTAISYSPPQNPAMRALSLRAAAGSASYRAARVARRRHSLNRKGMMPVITNTIDSSNNESPACCLGARNFRRMQLRVALTAQIRFFLHAFLLPPSRATRVIA